MDSGHVSSKISRLYLTVEGLEKAGSRVSYLCFVTIITVQANIINAPIIIVYHGDICVMQNGTVQEGMTK